MTAKMPGYNGKILRVNLSENRTSVDITDETFQRKYLGGAGYTTYFLLKELEQGIDALSPENKLVFASGPVTGVAVPGSGRHCVGAKSPLTGSIAKSEAGEFWGVELKRAGFDGIIIEGKAEKPVYLWVHDGEAEIKDAAHLWGRNTKETQLDIRSELGDEKVRVALIGPAGEKLVRYACIMHGLFDAAGRGGLGAVMGSKNLKAVAVRGRGKVAVSDPEKLREFRQWMIANVFSFIRGFHNYGTGGAIENFEASGNLPVHNFRDSSFPAKKISAVGMKDTITVGMDACYGCLVRCKKVVKAQKPYVIDPAYGGPEYESLAALGSNCGVEDVTAIAKGNERCNAYSLDAISTGAVIGFAMECFENGLLSMEDTGGIDLRFGNAEGMLQMIELIARRNGIGDLLANGVARAAEEIGKGAAEFAVHTKKLEPNL